MRVAVKSKLAAKRFANIRFDKEWDAWPVGLCISFYVIGKFSERSYNPKIQFV